MKVWTVGGVAWEYLSDHFQFIILSFRFGGNLAAPTPI